MMMAVSQSRQDTVNCIYMPKDCVEQTGIVTHTILFETVLFRIVKYILPPGANELKRNITRMHSARTNECTHNLNLIHT